MFDVMVKYIFIVSTKYFIILFVALKLVHYVVIGNKVVYIYLYHLYYINHIIIQQLPIDTLLSVIRLVLFMNLLF